MFSNLFKGFDLVCEYVTGGIAGSLTDGEFISLLSDWWFTTKDPGTLVYAYEIDCLIYDWVEDWLGILRHDDMGIISSLANEWSGRSDWLWCFGEISPDAFVRFRHRLLVPGWGLGCRVGWPICPFRACCFCHTSDLINMILDASLSGFQSVLSNLRSFSSICNVFAAINRLTKIFINLLLLGFPLNELVKMFDIESFGR